MAFFFVVAGTVATLLLCHRSIPGILHRLGRTMSGSRRGVRSVSRDDRTHDPMIPPLQQRGGPTVPAISYSRAQVITDDVFRASEKRASCQETLEEVKRHRRVCADRIRAAGAQAAHSRFLLAFRHALDPFPLGRLGVLIVTVGISAGLSVVVVAFSDLDISLLVTAAILGAAIPAAFMLPLLFLSSDGLLEKVILTSEEESGRLDRELQQSETRLYAAESAFEAADREYQRLERELGSRREDLASRDWRSLRGIAFEGFLKDVFEELGFQVETTKTSGDQGVDLIAVRGHTRIAVQAKGYSESVGNRAVQEAHTGMAYYRCSQCAVVTNSAFTTSARELAGRIGCRLIDGSQIIDLINDRISF